MAQNKIDKQTLFETRVYNNYRASMRSTYTGSGYPAWRKQKAREVTAARYKISHAEIKRIVAQREAA